MVNGCGSPACPPRVLPFVVAHPPDDGALTALHDPFRQPCFDSISGDIAMENPLGQGPESMILESLHNGAYGINHFLRMGPFTQPDWRQ